MKPKGCIEATLRTQGNAPIYYTLDGSEPTTNSTRYTEPIEIRTENDSCTLKAIVVREGIETRTLVRPFKFNKATGHMPQLKDAPSENILSEEPVYSPMAYMEISITATVVGSDSSIRH